MMLELCEFPTPQIGYWETYDGSQIREVDGSRSASINGMDIHGNQFLTGGGDKMIKVWHAKIHLLLVVCLIRCGTMTVGRLLTSERVMVQRSPRSRWPLMEVMQ